MGVFDRMGRVAMANVNSLLDRAESPEKSLSLTLTEMREHLRDARREVVRSVVAEKQLRRKLDELDAEIERWVGRAELAIRRGRDDLARAALSQKRRLAERRAQTEKLRLEQRGEALSMKSELENMERKLAGFTARKGTLAVLAQQARAGGGAEGLGATGAESPLSAFDDLEERLANVDVMFDAQREVDAVLSRSARPDGMSAAEVEAGFAALEGAAGADRDSAESGLDDELAELKKKYRVET